ncbi:MAG: histidine phosphatase family protein [Clostridia bacterium]|nr:histidine phosphatase family protein [Clostridia bacterium]
MNLYIMRHGLTQMNKDRKLNGQTDEDIIEEGIADAEKAREVVKDLPLDMIYCSPLIRTRHTCEIVNANHIPVIYDDRLKERTLGKIDGTYREENGFPDDKFFDYNYKFNIEGAETIPVFFGRVHEFLNELKEKDYQNVLIVAHGGVLRATYYYFNGIPEDGNIYKYFNNCEINHYEL